MSDYFLPFLVVLILLAALLRDNFVFTLLYLFTGATLLARWWSQSALSAVACVRTFPDRVFLGEKIPLRLSLVNQRWLPLVWLRVYDSLPVELGAPHSFQRVLSLGPRGHREFTYELSALRRGYYRIGPLYLYSGDVLGLFQARRREGYVDYLTVYPKILPLPELTLQSHSPLGTLRHRLPLFEDPARAAGKREYVVGDSLRRVDWKATAATGRVQVKHYEPSIDLELALYLNLNSQEYYRRTRIEATELAVVAAASIANWGIERKVAVGLSTNGVDAADGDGWLGSLAPRKGRGHLMRVLELLARVKAAEVEPFVDLIRREGIHRSWGTTLVLITGQVNDVLFDELFQAGRRGLEVVILLTGLQQRFDVIQQRARRLGFPIRRIHDERDLERLRN